MKTGGFGFENYDTEQACTFWVTTGWVSRPDLEKIGTPFVFITIMFIFRCGTQLARAEAKLDQNSKQNWYSKTYSKRWSLSDVF